MIYFVQGESTRLVKIGYTGDVSVTNRIAALQVGSPDTLRLLAATEGEVDDERFLHRRFSRLRTQGEWFKPDLELMNFIHYITVDPAAAMRNAHYKAKQAAKVCRCGAPKDNRRPLCDECFRLSEPAPPEPTKKRIPFDPRTIYEGNMAFKYARAKGEIKRLPCQVCGGEKSQAHHDDYTKPMEVVWLCATHRLERMKQLGWR